LLLIVFLKRLFGRWCEIKQHFCNEKADDDDDDSLVQKYLSTFLKAA